jgi:predicted TIM-barrel fold metal-dependent hydrolase
VSVILDSHCHLFPPAWAPYGRMPDDMFDVPGLLERQADAGVSLSVVSDPHIWYGELDPGDIERIREYNDFAAELARAHPGAIAALGSVTPWRGDAHVREAERACTELGLAGLALPTSDEGRYLDSVPQAFWELVTGLDVPVFVHPVGTVAGQELMAIYRLGEVCGRPLDTTITLARFILTGTFERHAALRLLCAHAGGAICTIADRLDFGHELRDYAPLGPWGDVELVEPPSVHVGRLYLDTVTYGTAALVPALERVGPNRLLYGSDRPPVPFPLARTIGYVRELGLPREQEEAILGGNARLLFGLA